MARKQPDIIPYRCVNRFGKPESGKAPCRDYGSKGNPGNIVQVKASEIPPGGRAPRCPGEGCGMDLEPLSVIPRPGPRPFPLKLVIAMAVICLGIAAVWALLPGGSPKISISPSPADWGSLPPGTSKPLALTISNAGKQELIISSGNLEGEGFGFSQPVERVPGGASREAVLLFSPTRGGAFSGRLTLHTNDPAQPTVAVDLTGSGAVGSMGSGTVDPEKRVRETFDPIDSKIPPAKPQ